MKAKKKRRNRPTKPGKPRKVVMRLYVTGATPRSTRAITNLRQLCEKHLPGGYELEVIDIYQQPSLAIEGQVIAAPTLVKSLPLPLRKFIGDMSDTQTILAALEVAAAATPGRGALDGHPRKH